MLLDDGAVLRRAVCEFAGRLAKTSVEDAPRRTVGTEHGGVVVMTDVAATAGEVTLPIGATGSTLDAYGVESRPPKPGRLAPELPRKELLRRQMAHARRMRP